MSKTQIVTGGITDGTIATSDIADDAITTAKIGTLTEIGFNATQSASADANTLDDYEEGTWTPVISGATGVTNLTGSYRKVGSLVTVWVYMLNGNIGGSPSYTITGLPFTVNEVRSTTSSIASYDAFASNATSVLGLLAISSTQIDFLYNVNGSAWLVQNINTASNVYLHFSASYIAN